MIRPYLAVLIDSLREALASRVLIAMGALITLVLVVIAPLTYEQRLTVSFRAQDVKNWEAFADAVRTLGGRRENPVAERIWQRLKDEEKRVFADLKSRPQDDDDFRKAQQFQQSRDQAAAAIERVLTADDFYDRKTWRRYDLPLEGMLLQSEGKKPDQDEVRRLNRIALEAAFVGVIRTSPPTSMLFRYAWLPLGEPLPVRPRQLIDVINAWLPFLIDKGLLAVGLIVAVIITAPIIPQMFEPGSLHLLLSKPVSRSLLFLTKFVGGCAFVVLCASYLFAGIWLILGSRWGLWEHRLLLCVPLYAIVFMIYYSVSALTGLWWRNTVLSVMAATLFWGLCFGLGTTKLWMEGPIEKSRILRLTTAGDSLIAVTGLHMPLEWNQETGKWRHVCVSEEQEQFTILFSVLPNLPTPIGPVYDRDHDQLVRVGFSFRKKTPAFISGKRGDGWKYVETPLDSQASGAFAALNEPDGKVLICTRLGLFRLTGELQHPVNPPKIFGIPLPVSQDAALTQVDDDAALKWSDPAAAAIDAVDGTLVIYSRGRLFVLRPNAAGKYDVVNKEKVLEDEDAPAVSAIAHGRIVLADREGHIRIFDADTLTVQAAHQPEGANVPRSVAASPDGHWFAVTFHNGKLWLLDVDRNTMFRAPIVGQGDLSTSLFTADGKWLAADRVTRVTEYETGTWKPLRSFAPPLDITEQAYRYGINPLYTLLPKPGEFYKTVQYLLTKQETTGGDEDSLEAPQRNLRPWAPVVSGLIFVGCVLAVCCVYIERQEF